MRYSNNYIRVRVIPQPTSNDGANRINVEQDPTFSKFSANLIHLPSDGLTMSDVTSTETLTRKVSRCEYDTTRLGPRIEEQLDKTPVKN